MRVEAKAYEDAASIQKLIENTLVDAVGVLWGLVDVTNVTVVASDEYHPSRRKS